jgi:hypothetical protein
MPPRSRETTPMVGKGYVSLFAAPLPRRICCRLDTIYDGKGMG